MFLLVITPTRAKSEDSNSEESKILKEESDYLSETFSTFLKNAKKMFIRNLTYGEESDLRYYNFKFSIDSGLKKGDNANPIELLSDFINSKSPRKAIYKESPISIVINFDFIPSGVQVGSTNYIIDLKNKKIPVSRFDIIIDYKIYWNPISVQKTLANEFGDILFYFLGFEVFNLYFSSLFQSDFETKRKASPNEDIYNKLYSTHFSFLIERFYENILD